MKTIKLNLDGKPVEAREGETILLLARRLGVEIPALCYDPRLPPYTSCFICIVEVEGRRGAAPACATKCEEGMTVRTSTENIRKLRKLGLELLLSNHHGDCVAPCSMACPAGIDIRAYLSEVSRGHYGDALRIIKERNPFPSVCGRVCPHRCEDDCRRRLVDEPVSINQVKRYVADLDRESEHPWKPELAPKNGKKIAVIGGGPGGLSAAYFLTQLGYRVSVLEAMPKAGGMLRYGIPDYRLPQDVLDSEIEQITGLGVELETGKVWGRDFHLDDLRKRGFSSIIVAVGAWSSSSMEVEGEDRPGVWSGIAMLEKVNKGEKVSLGDSVAVVGGGNTAMDCARTSLRLGSKSVAVVYRRSRKEMPANPDEIQEAEEEGVKFHFLTAPLGFVGDKKVTGMRCIKMQLGEPDKSGRRRPIPVPGSEFEMPLDAAIAAIGQKVRWDKGFDADGLKLTRWGTPEADDRTLQSANQGDVFICGDCFTGPATAIEAVAAGRAAALSAHSSLSGEKVTLSPHPFNIRAGRLEDLDKADYEHHAKQKRTPVPLLPAEVRARTYDEVSKTLPEKEAVEEAARCLLCGCQEVSACMVRRYAGEYGATGEEYAGEKCRPSEIPDHPFVVRDPLKCILCGRCVRVCAELQGVGSIGLVGRGFITQVSPAFSQSLQEVDCKSCGQCIATCPAGALSSKLWGERVPSWRTEKREVLCPYCGTGCVLTVEAADGEIQRVSHKMSGGDSDISVCSRGFTGFGLLESPDRLLEPMIKENGSWRKAKWDEAMKFASDGLRKAAQKGGKNAAVLGSPRLSNEALYLLQKIGRLALGTNHLGGLGIGGESDVPARALGLNVSTTTREHIINSDLILAVGVDLEAEYQAVASMVRAAVLGGTKLQVHYRKSTALDKQAYGTLRIAYPDTYAVYEDWLAALFEQRRVDADFQKRLNGLDALKNALLNRKPREKSPWLRKEKLDRMRDDLLSAQRPLVIADSSCIHNGDLTALLDILLLKGAVGRTGCGLILLRASCNGQGAQDHGMDGRWLPGYRSVGDAAARRSLEKLWGKAAPDWKGLSSSGIIQAAQAGTLAGILSWGDNGLSKMSLPNAFVAAGEWAVPSAKHPASVVFPASLFAEDFGSLTSWDRKVQQAEGWRKDGAPGGVVSPPPNWRIVADLAAHLGLPKVESLMALREEISKANRLYEDWDWSGWDNGTKSARWCGKEGPEGLYAQRFATEDGKANLLIPEEEETREPLEFFSYLAEQDLVEEFIRKRLEDVKSGAFR